GATGVAHREAYDFCVFAASLGMQARIALSTHRPRVAVFVSKADHCFHDLVLRWKAGDYPCDIVAVVSNHTDLGAATRSYELNFVHVPVAAGAKDAAEGQQL